MSFQDSTVEEALGRIQDRSYLLPAIQRRFVWRREQIVKLVDSLMRGYPIGSFLLWDLDQDQARDFRFYDFLADYHQRDRPHAPEAHPKSGQGVTAVLDGQQRLTALNIAARGSHAEAVPRMWGSNPNNYPVHRLYLNLIDDHNRLGLAHDLRFMSDHQAGLGLPGRDGIDCWFPVSAATDFANGGPDLTYEVRRRGIESQVEADAAYQRLYALWEAFTVSKPISTFTLKDADPDTVLEVFVRVNSGGTHLSASDLLLSMATNQWKGLNAREEVEALAKELNTEGGRQFGFTKDLVLKAALMVGGVDHAFRLSNFTQANMAKVEAAWPRAREALIRAADLLRQFGFVRENLTAPYAVVPLAYHLSTRAASDSYLVSDADRADREAAKQWVVRSQLKAGYWSYGLDTLLERLKSALDDNPEPGFPTERLEAAAARLGKSLEFNAQEIEDLLRLGYGDRRIRTILTALYPGLDLAKQFHVDHVFPRKRFTPEALTAAGVPADQVGAYQARVNLLPNLQILTDVPNKEKGPLLPSDWLAKAHPDESDRAAYLAANDLDGLPLGISDFLDFYDQRAERIRQRLRALLGEDADGGQTPDSAGDDTNGESGRA
ncbi:MAG: DUF262 domain-containing protein [Bifidobacteriaceae bacterium]|nr:DUF262 domain-containing protein [Bifidobacteriaceae bacterium]